MRKSNRARLEAAGWAVGSVKEFLGLSEADTVLIEMKLSLSRSLRDRREQRGLSQMEFAKRLQSANPESPKWKRVIPRSRWISSSVRSSSSGQARPISLKPFGEGRRAKVATPLRKPSAINAPPISLESASDVHPARA